jgi:hypothetical protein
MCIRMDSMVNRDESLYYAAEMRCGAPNRRARHVWVALNKSSASPVVVFTLLRWLAHELKNRNLYRSRTSETHFKPPG